MTTLEDVIKAHEELEKINDEIIAKQKETIALLTKTVQELKEIIETYILPITIKK